MTTTGANTDRHLFVSGMFFAVGGLFVLLGTPRRRLRHALA